MYTASQPSASQKSGHLPETLILPISFTITIKGVEELNYRIEEKEAFRIVGISQPMHREVEKNFEIVPGMWAKRQPTAPYRNWQP